MEIANSIPKYKKALFEHQMSLKYHIKVPQTYWASIYPKWEKMEQKERDSIIDAKYDEMDEFLSGAENAQKAFISHYAVDKFTNKPLPGWEIIPLDDKSKNDKYLPDAAAANSEILFSFLVDPTIFGAGSPGGTPYSGGAGSGSDKRESFLILTALMQADRDLILQPWEFVKEYNRYDPDYQLRFQDTVLTTLDTGAGTAKPIS
jgi:hypothetical protein